MIPPGEWCALIVAAGRREIVRPRAYAATDIALGERPLARLRVIPMPAGTGFSDRRNEQGRGHPEAAAAMNPRCDLRYYS